MGFFLYFLREKEVKQEKDFILSSIHGNIFSNFILSVISGGDGTKGFLKLFEGQIYLMNSGINEMKQVFLR